MSETIGLHALNFSIVTDEQIVMDDWQRLAHSNLASLHQSPEWCQAWASAFKEQLFFLRGELNGICCFLLPLQKRNVVSCTVLEPPGKSYCNINTGLYDLSVGPPQNASEVAVAQKKITDAIAGHADLLLIGNLPLHWRGHQSALSGMETIQNQNPSFQLPLLASFEETLSQLNAKRRRKKFRISQREAELQGGYRYYPAQSAAEIDDLLTTFFKQKAQRFERQGLPDVFAAREVQAFFKALAHCGKEDPLNAPLELHAIELNGTEPPRVISITGISRKGDHTICQFGSIDEEFAGNISPGELLFYHVIERENKLGTKLFDFGIGDQRYKRSWCPVITIQHDIHLAASMKGRALSKLIVGLTRLKAWIKGNEALYSFIQRLRRTKQQTGDD